MRIQASFFPTRARSLPWLLVLLLTPFAWSAETEQNAGSASPPPAESRQPPSRSSAVDRDRSSAEAQSRWRDGQVFIDGRWLTRQQVAQIARQDKRLAEYRKLRERMQ